MRVYWELVKLGFKRYSTYRGATFAGCFTNTIWGFMLASVQLALFRVRPHVAGYDVTDAITYVWVTQGMLMTVYIFAWAEIAQRIRTGDVATDFHRPVDFQGYWLAQDLGRAAYHAIFRGVPPILLASLVYHLRLPAHPETWLWFGASLVLAVCVSFALRFLANLIAFWVHDHRGIIAITGFSFPFLAGLFGVPLPFFPPAIYHVLAVLPFASVGQVPLSVFLEKPGVAPALAVQLFWALALLGLGRLVLRAAERRLVIQGG